MSYLTGNEFELDARKTYGSSVQVTTWSKPQERTWSSCSVAISGRGRMRGEA